MTTHNRCCWLLSLPLEVWLEVWHLSVTSQVGRRVFARPCSTKSGGQNCGDHRGGGGGGGGGAQRGCDLKGGCREELGEQGWRREWGGVGWSGQHGGTYSALQHRLWMAMSVMQGEFRCGGAWGVFEVNLQERRRARRGGGGGDLQTHCSD